MAEPMEVSTEGAASTQQGSSSRRRSSMGAGTTKSAADERVEAFFGMDPARFIDDCCNTIDDYISDGLDVMEASVLKKAKGDVSKELVVASINKLQKKYREVADANFAKFEEYLRRNILDVPEWVAEEEAKKSENSKRSTWAVSSEEAALDAELAALEQKLEETAAKKCEVKHELNESKARIRRGTQKFENVASMLEGMAMEDVDMLLTQAKALEPAVRQGRQLLSTMGSARDDHQGGRRGDGLRMGGKSDLEGLQQLNSRIFANLSNGQTSHRDQESSLQK